ncbi:tRNA-t(6)A37 methylthiotransferase [Lachnospiraceae bacterium KM106-2]|nr:tRNA-t(6)A37 methylthiotransferase [Lachnospiraceae bacterium KM106-2]
MGKINMHENNNRSVAFLTLGCKVNSYESDAMLKLFQEAGYEVREFNEKADVYVVNTCTVTNIADRKSRQMLHKAKKQNENSIVVAVGCYVQAAKDALEQDEAIDLVVGNNQKHNIVSLLEQYFEDDSKTQALIDINHDQEYEELTIDGAGEKTRAYIKVQDGCNQFCSYCIIPYARGRVRSRKTEDVVNEVNRLVASGYKEVVLTGIHLSSYGVDLEEGNLLSLIVAISKIDGIERIRLGSLEPRVITEEFVQTLSKDEKFCPHFHLSLQSGCDATLKRMNRKYSADEFYEKCCLIREYFDKPALTTDVIVGFPGETEEEFKTTKAFLEKVAFAQMHIFKYSKRKGTRAEVMPDQVDDSIKHARSTELMELEHRMRKAYEAEFIGQEEKILFEESITIEGKEYQIGHTKRYLKVACESEKDLSNEIISVKILENLTTDVMLSKIID